MTLKQVGKDGDLVFQKRAGFTDRRRSEKIPSCPLGVLTNNIQETALRFDGHKSAPDGAISETPDFQAKKRFPT